MDPSKERSFNDHWKKAFDEASVPPPASAWEGIEARLDQGITKHGFEDQWKKAFDDASVVPPASAWEGIEARLDGDDNKIVPLWWRSPRLWLAAASVAAVLVVGGIWMNNDHKRLSSNKVDVAVGTKSATKSNPAIANTRSASPSGADNKKDAVNPAAVSGEKSTLAAAELHEKTGLVPENSGRAKADAFTPITRSGDEKAALAAKVKTLPSVESEAVKDVVDNKGALLPVQENRIAALPATNEVAQDQSAKLKVAAEMLAALPYKELDVYFQKRYVFYEHDAKQDAPVLKKPKEYWAGVGLMPASFNPDVNLKTSPTSFASKSYASQKSMTGKNDPGFSYALQTQGGMRISKHWSVETGISYLQGKSNYEGGGYVLDAATNFSSNVLETALSDVYSTQKGGATTLVANSVYIDVSKQVRNDYRYLQLPVQAGFTLNPDGKLSYSVLGGMMANFFLNNELESGNGNVIKTTVSDEVYRGINWSATTGLRFNYRLSSRWKASLTGSYQKAVTSGFRTNQNLESHPYLYGVSWGMRYSF